MKYKTFYSSIIGNLTLISDGKYLTHIVLEKEKYYQNLKNEAKTENNLEIFKQTKTWLDKYFNGEKPHIDNLKLKLEGTNFEIKVWNIIKKIPYGKLITYSDIAQKLDSKAFRAIGRATGHNPIPIIIPCHRVVGKNGKLTGYTGGLDVKIKLLKIENIKEDEYAKM